MKEYIERIKVFKKEQKLQRGKHMNGWGDIDRIGEMMDAKGINGINQ